MEIYPDIIFLENLVINYLILQVTAKFARRNASNLRIFTGALIGAIYVVALLLLPDSSVYYTIEAKILLSLVIVAVTFSPGKISSFIKVLAVFYLSTFVFAGAAFAFIYFNPAGGFVKNGVIYMFRDSKWTTLVLSLLTAVIVVRVFWEVIQFKFGKEKLIFPVLITFDKNSIRLSALVDTGNSLKDPLTNMPVVVVEFAAIKNILPEEIKKIFDHNKEDDLNTVTDAVTNSGWHSRFRLIPFTSLGKENGMLLGFKPDYIEIGEEDEKKDVSDVIVGIYNRALSRNEKYRALLSPELI